MNTSNFTRLDSSNLASAYHDGEDLYLEFRNGKVYRYKSVPEAVFDELVVTESAGRFFHSSIRDNFAYEALKNTELE